MLVHKPEDEGFGLVEVIIAIFILALIAVAMLPGLYNGIAASSTQARTATATRFLYSVVEQGREKAPTAGGPTAWCGWVGTKMTPTPSSFTASVVSCTPDSNSLVTLTLKAMSTGTPSKQLATVTAKVYVP